MLSAAILLGALRVNSKQLHDEWTARWMTWGSTELSIGVFQSYQAYGQTLMMESRLQLGKIWPPAKFKPRLLAYMQCICLTFFEIFI